MAQSAVFSKWVLRWNEIIIFSFTFFTGISGPIMYVTVHGECSKAIISIYLTKHLIDDALKFMDLVYEYRENYQCRWLL